MAIDATIAQSKRRIREALDIRPRIIWPGLSQTEMIVTASA